MQRVQSAGQPRRAAAGASARALAPYLLLAVAVTAIDQLSKAAIRGWLALDEGWPRGWELIRLSHVENTGAAFGILQGAGAPLIVVTVLGIGAVCFYLRQQVVIDRWYAVPLALILGGAVGNLLDRVLRGAVTDFIDPTHYPAFNLADSSIVIAVVVIAARALLFAPREPEAQP